MTYILEYWVVCDISDIHFEESYTHHLTSVHVLILPLSATSTDTNSAANTVNASAGGSTTRHTDTGRAYAQCEFHILQYNTYTLCYNNSSKFTLRLYCAVACCAGLGLIHYWHVTVNIDTDTAYYCATGAAAVTTVYTHTTELTTSDGRQRSSSYHTKT